MTSPALAQDRVNWFIQDFPPAYIVSGSAQGTGVSDQAMRYFLERMTQFDHHVDVAPLTRAWTQIAHEDGNCLAAVLKSPERAGIALFSKPIFVTATPRLLIRHDHIDLLQPALDAEGAVDLQILAGRKSVKAISVTQRSYGPEVDRFLLALHDLPARVATSAQAVRMVENGRGDFTFGYTFETRFFALESGTPNKLDNYPIARQPKFLPVRMACSKGPIGEKIIERVNQIIDMAGWPPPFLHQVSRWFIPEELTTMLNLPTREEDSPGS